MLKTRIQRFIEALKHLRTRSIVIAIAVLFIAAVIAVYIGNQIHAMKNETLLLRGELNTREATMEYNRYLLTRVDIVTMVANNVEDFIESGADNAMIEGYLKKETENIIKSLDPGTTGLYGLFNGSYLDGSGWVPEADFVPTERPWYKETIHSGKEITFVKPYIDAQTNTTMLTVAKLLRDGESVLAMDVSLAPIQDIVERISASDKGGQAFLINEDGYVIAHSDVSQLGRNYMDEPDSLGGLVTHRLLTDGLKQFDLHTAEGKYVVYIDNLEGDWYSVSLINSDVWYRPLHRTMFIFSVIILLVIVAIIGFFLELTEKNITLQKLHDKVDEEQKKGAALQVLSETDRMTGLNDRVSGERKVTELISAGHGGMFLELDIDHFKSINDTYGHQTGDIVVHAVADALRGAFRTNDIIVRLGGDEFVVFAVGISSREMGESVVFRFFSRVNNLVIPELRGEKVCISVGAVLTPDHGNLSFHELYGIADKALYISKKTPGSSLTFGER